MVCAWGARMSSFKDLLVEFSTVILSHRASTAYSGYRINHCGLTARRTIHLLIYRSALRFISYSGRCAFVSWTQILETVIA